MNKLVLIGNGFDLAHELPTSYNDFILWYLNNAFNVAKNKYIYEDKLLKIKHEAHFKTESFTSVEQFNKFYVDNNHNAKISIDSIIFTDILRNLSTAKWVDIERNYYKILKILSNDNSNNVKHLNEDFQYIKKLLEKYLTEVSKKEIPKLNGIKEILQRSGNKHYIDENKNRPRFEKTIIVNFNYTNTVLNYYNTLDKYIILNNIHGNLNDKENPIIFGYGDEIDENYEKIKNLNNNDFLENIKSFDYFKTSNYRNLINYLDEYDYEVIIMGHSCGLSDRILLNTIFEHDKCLRIQIYYYKRSEEEGDNDYREKSMEISRHFKDSAKFRKRLVPFSESKPLVPYSEQKRES